MSKVSQDILRKRLSWVENARQGMLRAMGDDFVDPTFQIFPTVDPIRVILKITLRMPVRKETREPIRQYLRYWAEENGCELPVIRIEDTHIQAEVLIQHRHWSKEHGRPNKFGKRFVRRPR